MSLPFRRAKDKARPYPLSPPNVGWMVSTRLPAWRDFLSPYVPNKEWIPAASLPASGGDKRPLRPLGGAAGPLSLIARLCIWFAAVQARVRAWGGDMPRSRLALCGQPCPAPFQDWVGKRRQSHQAGTAQRGDKAFLWKGVQMTTGHSPTPLTDSASVSSPVKWGLAS